MPEAAPAAAAVAPVAPAPVAPQSPGSGTEPPKPAAAAPESGADYLEIVIDGEQRKVSRQEAITRLQKEEAADKRFQQAAEKERRTGAMLDALANDPEATLEKLGIDLDAIAEKRLAKKAQDKLLTEEQRKQKALEDENARLKAEHKKREEAEKATKQAKLDEQTFTTLEKELLGAAERHKLDSDPGTLEMMCDVALEAIDLGYPLTSDQVALETLRRQGAHSEAYSKKLLKALKGEKLLKHLGPDVVKAVQDATLEQMKIAKPAPPPEEEKPRPTEKKHYLSERDLDARFAKRGIK